MAHRPNFTAFLENKESVYDVAKALGFTQTRGAGVGEGSPREMLEAIGGGEAFVVHVADDMEYELVNDLASLAESNPALGDLLRRIASSLELAKQMNE